MRLISQDGEVDVPYEHGSLCIGFIKGEEHIVDTISYYNYSCQKGTKLAEYSSKAKALKVMEMLREQYMKLGMIKILASGTCEYTTQWQRNSNLVSKSLARIKQGRSCLIKLETMLESGDLK